MAAAKVAGAVSDSVEEAGSGSVVEVDLDWEVVEDLGVVAVADWGWEVAAGSGLAVEGSGWVAEEDWG